MILTMLGDLGVLALAVAMFATAGAILVHALIGKSSL